MISAKELRYAIERKKGSRDKTEKDMQTKRQEVLDLQTELDAAKEARTILQLIAQQTQQQVQIKFGKLVDLAQNIVFPRPYKIEFDFVPKRNRMETDLYFVRDDRRTMPGYESGGGAVDIGGFALQASSLMLHRKLKSPNTQAVLVLDEPFKHLKGETANKRAIEMVKTLSQHTGIQVIMVSDERAAREDIIAGADRVFLITQNDENESQIKVI
jgi:hypothetical protein